MQKPIPAIQRGDIAETVLGNARILAPPVRAVKTQIRPESHFFASYSRVQQSSASRASGLPAAVQATSITTGPGTARPVAGSVHSTT